jgi:hypothetical protein
MTTTEQLVTQGGSAGLIVETFARFGAPDVEAVFLINEFVRQGLTRAESEGALFSYIPALLELAHRLHFFLLGMAAVSGPESTRSWMGRVDMVRLSLGSMCPIWPFC